MEQQGRRSCGTCLSGHSENIRPEVYPSDLPTRGPLEGECHLGADLVTLVQQPGDILLGTPDGPRKLRLRSVKGYRPLDVTTKIHTSNLVNRTASVN